jgi:hypothetical protein
MENPLIALSTAILLLLIMLLALGAAELISQALGPVSIALMEG